MQEKLSKKEIGLRIKSIRAQNGYSQAYMADLLKISRSNYSQIELGNQYPTFELLAAIARYYSKSYEWLLHGRNNTQTGCDYHNLERALPNISFTCDDKRILKISNHADYVKKLKDINYLKTLPSFDPVFINLDEEHQLRAFCVNNPPSLKHIYNGDIIVGGLMKCLSEIILNEIYLLVTSTDILICKIVEITDNGDAIVYQQDEGRRRSTLNFLDIQEVWRAQGKYSSIIQPEINNMEEEVVKLNELIVDLRAQVSGLKRRFK